MLLLGGNDNPIVHLAGHEAFEGPQQMIRRDPEHRRAQAAELIERQHGSVGLHVRREAIDEVDLGADGPGGSDGALAHRFDDVFRRPRVVCRLDDEVDRYNADIIEELIRVMRRSPEMVEPGLSLFSATRHLERIADHATNIAEDVVYLVEGEIIRHRPAAVDVDE